MPSLSSLKQFKSSFDNIANERADIEGNGIPFNDLKLPTTEAPPFEFNRSSPLPGGGTDSDLSSIADGAGGGDFDLDSFMDTLPSGGSPADDALSALDDFLKDLNPDTEDTPVDDLTIDEFPAEEFPAEDIPAEDSLVGDFPIEDFTSDDLPVEDVPAEDSLADDFPADEFPTEDLPTEDFPADDFPTDEYPAEEDDTSIEDEFGGAIDLGGESPYSDYSSPEFDDEDSDTDGFETADFGSTDPDTADAGTADTGIDNTGTDNTGTVYAGSDDLSDFENGIDLGGESPDFTPGSSAASDDFSMDGVLSDSDMSTMDTSADSSLPDTDFSDFDLGGSSSEAPLDMSDFGSDFATDSIELENETQAPAGGDDVDDFGSSSFGGDSFDNDDFSLAGLDDILNKSRATEITVPVQRKKFFGRKKVKAEEIPDAEEDIEEISLSQEDVDRLLKTLAAYPLNLRIVCEELIAEQVILPAQLSRLIRLLVNGAHVKETAAHVESITGKPVIIPKSFEKGTGAAFEAEQSSFAYIFIHNFLPVFRLFAIIAVLLGSVIYLGYKLIYIPVTAESLYKRGYERIPAGEYQRANELFHQAFTLHRKKKWFYSYAEAFRDQRRYMLAEGKYDELLRFYPRDKKGVLDYAGLNTHYLMNYEKANRLLQRELLDYAPNDFDALLAAGDNFLLWADSNPSRFYDRYEDARFCYARLLDRYGWQPPIVERMMTYFIRTDNLRETLQLRAWFETGRNRQLSAESLAELGGYLLDKQLDRPGGVPDPYIENIESVRAMLLQAVRLDPLLPEPHYHLARYHHNLSNVYEERLTLENAARAFDLAKQESIRRRIYRVDTQYRYANILINNREFFPAEEQVVKGIELYEDYLNRNLIGASPQLGQLYSLWGDLEYFVKTGNMNTALANYRRAEVYGYAPPEVQYRMGAAYYQLGDWRNALEYLFKASADLPLNRRLLFALGNAAYQRGDYFAAQGYYNRLLDILELQRVRLPVLLPNDSVQFLETGERLMMARNNLGVVNEALAGQTGNRDYLSRARVMYAESSRAWDAITRNPESMTRMRLSDSPGAPSINLGYLNANNSLRSSSGYRPEIFVRIDRDVLEPSRWEELAPFGGR